MNDQRGKNPAARGITRRHVIGTAAAAAGVAGAGLGCIRSAAAQAKKPASPKPVEKKPAESRPEDIEGHFNHKYKMTPESVHYFDKGVPGSQICAGCHYYIDPTECLVVEGYVSPYGWCDYYND